MLRDRIEVRPVTWLDIAACREADPELFFPLGTGGPDVFASAQALSICGRCEVRQTCLDWAVEQRIAYGIWGGTTEQQREQLARSAASA